MKVDKDQDQELFLISIGGSGTRVIESLLHMLAIGGKSQGWPATIHILIMEMDAGNGNLDRLKNLHNRYEKLHGAFSGFEEPIGCFWPEVRLYHWTPAGNDELQSMDMHEMVNAEKNVRLLSKLLYTENEMSMKIDVGFKGRPAVGVAYFKKLTDAQGSTRAELDAFVHSVEESKAERILVISSCHGGTGATGIPKIESILRDHGLNVSLGLLLMLPTFSVPEATNASGTGINSSSFNDKVKTVLSYYASENLLCEHIRGGSRNGYKWTFLLGYPDLIPFDVYSEGRITQCNPATFLDWYACVAIKRFYDNDIPLPDGTTDMLLPGLYMSQLNRNPWDFRRFEQSFPTLAEDVTAMLQVANLYDERIRPALWDLCQLNPGNRLSARDTFTRYTFLSEFFSHKEAELDRAAIAREFQIFGEYLSSYVVWLCQIMLHTPTSYPESPYDYTRAAFHGIKPRELDRIVIPNEKPECIRSLMFQTFVNGPFLYKLYQEMGHGEKIERPSVYEANQSYILLQLLDELTSRVEREKRLNSITAVQSAPKLMCDQAVGMIWNTCRHSRFISKPGSELEDKSRSEFDVWVFLASFVQTIRRYYAFGKR